MYRLHSEYETLTQFAAALAEEGVIYEDSIFSRWKNGNRFPRSRKVVLAMLKVFIKRKSLSTVSEANDFLETVSQRDLTDIETHELFGYRYFEKSDLLVIRDKPLHLNTYFAYQTSTSIFPFLKKS